MKDHDFSGGERLCGADPRQYVASGANLTSNYTMILQQTRIMQIAASAAGRRGRQLPEPVPTGSDVDVEDRRTVSAARSTRSDLHVRWPQLPPALTTIDQVFQKLNRTLKEAMAPFHQGPSGNRWVYVDIYPKFKTTA